MKRVPFVLTLLLGILGCQVNEPQNQGSVDRVRVEAPESMVLQRGEIAEGVVRLQISEGYHVQANPVPMRYLIPTQFEIDESKGILHASEPEYPEGMPYSLHGSPDTLMVYEGLVEIRYSILSVDTVQTGIYEVDGVVTYQMCDDRMCFPPVSEAVVVSVEVL